MRGLPNTRVRRLTLQVNKALFYLLLPILIHNIHIYPIMIRQLLLFLSTIIFHFLTTTTMIYPTVSAVLGRRALGGGYQAHRHLTHIQTAAIVEVTQDNRSKNLKLKIHPNSQNFRYLIWLPNSWTLSHWATSSEQKCLQKKILIFYVKKKLKIRN